MNDEELMHKLATDWPFVQSLGIVNGWSMEQIMARARAVVGPEPVPEPEPEPKE